MAAAVRVFQSHGGRRRCARPCPAGACESGDGRLHRHHARSVFDQSASINVKTGADYELAASRPIAIGVLEQTVDFANRDESATNNLYPGGVVTKELHLKNGFTFISKPFSDPISIDGAISGLIRASINKRDVDVTLAFYELTPEGKYFNLGYYLARTSVMNPLRTQKCPCMCTGKTTATSRSRSGSSYG